MKLILNYLLPILVLGYIVKFVCLKQFFVSTSQFSLLKETYYTGYVRMPHLSDFKASKWSYNAIIFIICVMAWPGLHRTFVVEFTSNGSFLILTQRTFCIHFIFADLATCDLFMQKHWLASSFSRSDLRVIEYIRHTNTVTKL